MSDTTSKTLESSFSVWERGFERVVEWIPYVTLIISLALALLGARTWPDRLAAIGLATAAALWTLFTFTLRHERRQDRTWTLVYYAGFLAFAVVAMALVPAFFVYVITGFFHAFLLRPAPLAFVGVAITSLAVNSRIIYPDPTPDELWTYGIIVVIQTLAVGFGVLGGEKIGELSEQRRRSLVELETALEENAGLHAQLVAQAREAGVTDERQRMAREIHDTIAQGLTGVITQLEAARQVKGNHEELQRRIDNATRLARESLAEARRSVQAVMPVPLEERSLPDAIAHVSARWSSLSRVPAEVNTTGNVRGLHPEVEVTVLRVTQEALANIAKHANASRVGVTLSFMDDVVSIDVRDDGAGFSPLEVANGSSGFGLTAMRQRVEGLSGVLEIESEPGGGTAVSATLPAIPVGVEIG